jgi:hypothetical protein
LGGWIDPSLFADFFLQVAVKYTDSVWVRASAGAWNVVRIFEIPPILLQKGKRTVAVIGVVTEKLNHSTSLFYTSLLRELREV